MSMTTKSLALTAVIASSIAVMAAELRAAIARR